MADDIAESTGAGDEPHESPAQPGPGDAAGTVPERGAVGTTTEAADGEEPADRATAPPAAPQAPVAPGLSSPEATPAGSGQRRITRHTTTMTTRTESETTTDEKVVETIAVAPGERAGQPRHS